MGTHRRKWGWWLVAALAVAVAASLLFHRKPDKPSGQPDASAPVAEADSAVTVVRDTVYVKVDDETVPVVRERTVEAGDSEGKTPAAVAETVVTVPVQDLNNLVRGKSGRNVTLATQAPDRITVSYSGKVDVPLLGEQNMDVSADFKVVEVKGDRLVLQMDSGAAKNLAADMFAPLILERLPEGLVDSFSDGRAVVNLSAVPQLKKKLNGLTLTGVSVDESNIRLTVVK